MKQKGLIKNTRSSSYHDWPWIRNYQSNPSRDIENFGFYKNFLNKINVKTSDRNPSVMCTEEKLE